MGTKNRPGDFDCYANAEPDEPMFVLLGRDRDAPALVEAWADARQEAGEDPAKVAEARLCAQQMRVWRASNKAVLRERDATAIATKLGCDPAEARAALFIAEMQNEWIRSRDLGGRAVNAPFDPVERAEWIVEQCRRSSTPALLVAETLGLL